MAKLLESNIYLLLHTHMCTRVKYCIVEMVCLKAYLFLKQNNHRKRLRKRISAAIHNLWCGKDNKVLRPLL